MKALLVKCPSVQWQPDGSTIHFKKWLLGARFLGAPPISLNSRGCDWPHAEVSSYASDGLRALAQLMSRSTHSTHHSKMSPWISDIDITIVAVTPLVMWRMLHIYIYIYIIGIRCAYACDVLQCKSRSTFQLLLVCLGVFLFLMDVVFIQNVYPHGHGAQGLGGWGPLEYNIGWFSLSPLPQTRPDLFLNFLEEFNKNSAHTGIFYF